ncbi:hypothetical protein [Brevundimonas diminuta]|uniref:hypothetical protein n=1 Tax=Brevundimonas diminuta TaxID=293 RepID=UPI003D9AB4D0
MVVRKRSQYENAMVGNAGLNFAAWQLSRRGWHALPTIRNARGSDLYVTNGDETVFFGVQSKALSRRSPVPLGKDGDTSLRLVGDHHQRLHPLPHMLYSQK